MTTVASKQLQTSALVGVIAVGAAVRLYFALAWHVEYDEPWNLFYAVVRPLDAVWAELNYHAHPPLAIASYWVAFLFGDPPMAARVVSIVAGLAGVVLSYHWAVRLGLSRQIALLIAFLLAVAPVWVHLSIVVRYYTLMNAALVTAALVFVRVVREPDRTAGSRIAVFVVAALAAMWTEYVAMFAIAAMLLSLPALALAGMLPWRAIRDLAWRHWMWWLALGLGTAGVIAYFGAKNQSIYHFHVSEFYRTAGEGYLAFVWRGLGGVAERLTFFDWLGPSAAALAIAIGLLGLVALEVRRGRDPARAGVVLTTAFLIVELAALGAAGKYPFGGLTRHQVVLFPFLVTLFGLGLDWIFRALPARRTALASTLVALATIAFCTRGLAQEVGKISTVPLFAGEYAALRPSLSRETPIYLTRFTHFGFFGHTMTQRWHCIARPATGVFDYEVGEAGREYRVVVDRVTWEPEWPVGPALAQRLAGIMRATRAGELTVVSLTNGERADDAPNGRDDSIRALTASGLALDDWFRIGQGFAFRVRDIRLPR